MDVRRLRLLLELSRLGSMHEVAAELGTSTSTVSQGISALARDAGTALVEPDGRRVRLTPAGRRQRPPPGHEQDPGPVPGDDGRHLRRGSRAERDPRDPAQRERGNRRGRRHDAGVSG